MPKQTTEKTTLNHLEPIHKLMQCIETDYKNLEKLLESIPSKLKKSEGTIKAKVKKATEKQAKAKKAWLDAKATHKTKPTATAKKRLEKCEATYQAAKAEVETLRLEQKPLSEQLKTCLAFKKEHIVVKKSLNKVNADSQKKTTKAIKKKRTNKKAAS